MNKFSFGKAVGLTFAKALFGGFYKPANKKDGLIQAAFHII